MSKIPEGRMLDLPIFNDTTGSEDKSVRGRSLDPEPNDDVFKAEGKTLDQLLLVPFRSGFQCVLSMELIIFRIQ